VAALQAADIIALEGDASAAQSFVDLFSLRHIGDIATTGANAGDRG
jgi:hypothetical protein